MRRPGDTMQRWAWGWHVGFFVLLWGAVVLVAVSRPGRAVPALAGSAALTAWYVLAWPRGDRASDARVAVVLAVTVAAGLALAFVHPLFLAPTGFLTGHVMFWLPLRWGMIGGGAIGLGIGARLVQLLGPAGLVAGTIMAAVAIFLGLYIESIVRQSEQRRALIQALEATRAQLAAAERQAGVVAERARVAREIHDTVIQDVISVIRLVESARAGGRDPADVDRQLALAEQAAREALAEARRLVDAYRPPGLDASSLPDALDRLCARFAAETGVAAEVVLATPLGGLPPEAEVALLRATQEALANVKKHAAAASVSVTVTHMDDRVVLDVRDDGAGFVAGGAATAAGPGYGLVGLRERVAELGGNLLVETAPGEGTTVCVELPLAPAPPPAREERA